MIQIIRLSYHDDKDTSTSVGIKICSSVDNAKKVILSNVCVDFDENWKSLKEAAKELRKCLWHCSWDEEEKTFTWLDNGKGETYIICELDRGNMKWQNIGEIS
jgi:hypothetical protein